MINGQITKRWIYQDKLTPAAEVDSVGNVVTRFAPGYITKGDSTYALITDHLGSVRLVVNTQSGAIKQRIEYDEYGNVLVNTNPDFQPFGYSGGLYDDATKLVRFGARDYSAKEGRWTSKDPIGFGGGVSNLYEYVVNDPINKFDRNGLQYTGIKEAGIAAMDKLKGIVGKEKWEYGIWIYKKGGQYFLTDPIKGYKTDNGFSTDFDGTKPKNGKATAHGHPSENTISPDDANWSNFNKTRIFVLLPDGRYLDYDPFRKGQIDWDRVRDITPKDKKCKK